MKIEFLSAFEKDLARSKDKTLAGIVLECIQIFEEAQDLRDVPNIKKLKAHETAFRYRKVKYRIGFYLEDDTVLFAAFHVRGNFYKKFP
jgi:mRNA interferase RelE/StbE